MTHAPKIGALQAYAEDLLSERGRARVERHLGRCDACRRALASIELYRSTVEDVRAAPAPELDWSKMELALAREARTVSAGASAGPSATRRVPYDGAIAIALAAAAVVALALWPRDPSIPIAVQAPIAVPAPDEAPIAEPVPTVALVTLASGVAQAHGEAGARALEVGSEIVAGERITTETGSSLHASIGAETGVALAASSEVELGGEDGAVELALALGGVTAQVAPDRAARPDGREGSASSARFVVLAAEHRFVAHGTRFEVALDGSVVRLAVAEGEVAVHRPDGSVVIVRAPDTWSSDGGSGGAEGEPVLAAPHGLSESAAAWPIVRVQRADIVRWEIGDVRVDGLGGLAMRAPPGELAIAGFDAVGVAFRTVAIVGADGLSLGADALVPEPPRVSEGTIPEEDVVDVVEAGAPRLRRCYELALRARPDLEEAHAMARVTVAFDGSVARVQLRGDPLPPAIDQCVRTHLGRLTFPPPRGGSTFRFDLPIEFAPQR